MVFSKEWFIEQYIKTGWNFIPKEQRKKMLSNPVFLTIWHALVITAGVVLALNAGDLHHAVLILTATGSINALSSSPFGGKQ